MPELEKKYLFRMTHMENIPHILQNGITHSTSENANPNFISIGDPSIIAHRNEYLLKNGRKLGNYIPFYFAKRTPMLYIVQKGFNMVTPTPAEKIVYCVSSVQKIIDLRLDFVFTDGHAINCLTTQFKPADIENIERIIDWTSLEAKYWKDVNDLDLKRKKEAEFLVLGDISKKGILGYVVYNSQAFNKLIELGIDSAKIKIKPNFYF